MKLSEFTKRLSGLENLLFYLPDGSLVPEHFHVTEIGKVQKQFIDCGGTMRMEEKISFQLFEANDYNHRLHPEKLIKIIELAINKLELPDVDIEVEYQGESIQKFHLASVAGGFELLTTETACLATDNCGIPQEKPKVKLSEIQNLSCNPKTGCC